MQFNMTTIKYYMNNILKWDFTEAIQLMLSKSLDQLLTSKNCILMSIAMILLIIC